MIILTSGLHVQEAQEMSTKNKLPPRMCPKGSGVMSDF